MTQQIPLDASSRADGPLLRCEGRRARGATRPRGSEVYCGTLGSARSGMNWKCWCTSFSAWSLLQP